MPLSKGAFEKSTLGRGLRGGLFPFLGREELGG